MAQQHPTMVSTSQGYTTHKSAQPLATCWAVPTVSPGYMCLSMLCLVRGCNLELVTHAGWGGQSSHPGEKYTWFDWGDIGLGLTLSFSRALLCLQIP